MKNNLFVMFLGCLACLTGSQKAFALDQVDGVYQIGSAQDLEAFSNVVASGSNTANAVLTADIDMTGVDHQPIGTVSSIYKGTFDGQDHFIRNMIIDLADVQYVGLFGVIGNSAYIKNVIVDASCSISGKAFVGGIAGGTNGGGSVTFENCGNEGTVSAAEQNAAGICGVSMGSSCGIVMKNCFNSGAISGGYECAALCGWVGDNGSSITNCYNLGTISGVDGNYSLWRNSKGKGLNNYDSYGNQGTLINPLGAETGAISYILNGNQSDNPVWFQTLGADIYPLPFSSHGTVYAVGDLNCDGSSKDGDLTFSNSNASNRDPHTFVDGICTACSEVDVDYLTLTDGYYELSNAVQLNWFAQLVNKSHKNVNARLTADIDFTAYTQNDVMIGGIYEDGNDEYNEARAFEGIFDGQGHKITVNYNVNYDACALFKMVSDATIRNLEVDGMINSTQRFVGGMGFVSRGNSLFENNIVNVNISSSYSGDGVHGGFFAVCHENPVFRNCAFVGTMDASLSMGSAAIIGYAHGNVETKIENCYVATQNLWLADNSTVIARHVNNIINCYYTDNILLYAGDNVTMVEASTVATGELCYMINSKSNDNGTWRQTLGTDAYPVPFEGHKVVYSDGKGNYLNNESDMTSLLVNPDFEQGKTGWTGFNTVAAQKWNNGSFNMPTTGGPATNTLAEAYSAPEFDLYQVVENAPVGVYEISVQGFCRNGRGDTAWNNYQNQTFYSQPGNFPVYVYLNAKQTPFVNVFSEVKEGGYTTSAYDEFDGQQFPNTMENAVEAFSAGMYKQKAYGLVAQEGAPMRIGVKGHSAGLDGEDDNWVIFDNFKLTFKGNDAETIKPILDEEIVTAQTKADKRMGKTQYTALVNAIGAAQSATQGTDGEVMFQCLSDLFEVESAADASAEAFIPLADALNNLIAQIEIYMDSNPTAAGEAGALYTTISNNLSWHTTYEDSDVDGLIDEISAAITKMKLPAYDTASDLNPIDMTSVIVNPSYSEGVDGWNGTEPGWGNYDARAADHYDKNYDMYQTFLGLPAGTYQVSVNGFYRAGYADNDYLNKNNSEYSQAFLYAQTQDEEGNEITSSKALKRLNEVLNMEGYQYANYNSNYVDGYAVAHTDTIAGVDGAPDTYTYDLVPNNVLSGYATLNTGYFTNVVTVKVAEGAPLRIGLKKNQSIAKDWTLFDEWKLTYFGKESAKTADGDPSVITIYVQADEAPYLWAWNGSDINSVNIFSESWPGRQFTKKKTVQGTEFWYYTFDRSNIPINILFNNGAGKQTEDINGITSDSYFTYDGASTYADVTEQYLNVSHTIDFADANVKAICVANWDTDGDGELSEAEAAAVTSLGDVFRNNTQIASFDELQYFTGLSSIGDYAFYHCSGLTSVTIPSSVTSIGIYAFYHCSGLTSVTIPSSVTSIGSYAFVGCSGLTSMEIPNSVTSIGGSAFYGCYGLTSVTIPNSVTSIGDYSFYGCGSLTSVTVDIASPLLITDNTFSNRANATLYVPCGSKAAYEVADYWKEFGAIVETVEVTDVSTLANVIYIEPTEAITGTETVLSVKMKNNAEIQTIQFDLYLPDGVTVVPNEDGELITASKARINKFNYFESTIQTDGAIRLLAQASTTNVPVGDGEICKVVVSVPENMDEGDYPITFKDILMIEKNNTSHSPDPNIVQSKLTVFAYTPGDANNDGSVNAVDFNMIGNHILGHSQSGFNVRAADMNGDSSVNAIDFNMVGNVILYGNASASSRMMDDEEIKDPS